MVSSVVHNICYCTCLFVPTDVILNSFFLQQVTKVNIVFDRKVDPGKVVHTE